MNGLPGIGLSAQSMVTKYGPATSGSNVTKYIHLPPVASSEVWTGTSFF